MDGVLHVGFYNYVTSDSVIAILDYKIAAAKRLVKTAKEDKPRSVIDVTRGRKAVSLIVLTGDRYVISAIHRQQLAKRLGTGSEAEPTENLTPPKGGDALKGEKPILNGSSKSEAKTD